MTPFIQIFLIAAAAGMVGFAISHAWIWYMMSQMKPWHPLSAKEILDGNIGLGTGLAAALALIIHLEGGGLGALALAILLSYMIFPAIFMVVTTIQKIVQIIIGGYSQFLQKRLGDPCEGYKEEDNK